MRRTTMNTKHMTQATTGGNEPLTIAGALEKILYSYVNDLNVHCLEDEEDGQDDQKRTEAWEQERESTYDYVTSRLDLTRSQAEIFAAALDLTFTGTPTMSNIADRLLRSSLRLLSQMKDMDVLVEKRYVRIGSRGFKGKVYEVPDDVIRSIQRDEKPTGVDYSSLSAMGMVRRWNGLFCSFFRDGLCIETLRSEVAYILKGAKDNSIVRAWDAWDAGTLGGDDQLMLIYMLTRNAVFGDNSFEAVHYSKLFEDGLYEGETVESFRSGTDALFGRGIVEHGNRDGTVDTNVVRLTNRCRNDFLSDVGTGGSDADCTCRSIIPVSSIRGKDMYYNDGEGRQVDRLVSLLQRESFDSIVARLQEKGMRRGFCCLLHGGPGTGKTETVYQIARQTGRDVFLVDVSQLRSKWVGDSERNVKAVFDEYRGMASRRRLAPILLFNEADAIFGTRTRSPERAADRMDNTIQNIILQEMEGLEGIMIATTNLTCNFDPAFERRFIYKICLSTPGVEARTHIWRSLVEGISEQDARALAGEFSLSGGQIENISRKMTVDYILSGVQPGLGSIRELCSGETIAEKPAQARTRVGF